MNPRIKVDCHKYQSGQSKSVEVELPLHCGSEKYESGRSQNTKVDCLNILNSESGRSRSTKVDDTDV